MIDNPFPRRWWAFQHFKDYLGARHSLTAYIVLSARLDMGVIT